MSRARQDERASSVAASSAARPTFAAVYEEHFPFVWRTVRRLGVRDGAVDDVVQEIFVVAFKKLPSFEGRSSVKTWLFGITLHVVRDHRRSIRRKSPWSSGAADPETLPAGEAQGPHERVAGAQAAKLLQTVLDELHDEKREVFVCAELEQMSAPEIADALHIPLNTVYSRLRVARQQVDAAVARLRARDEWRLT